MKRCCTTQRPGWQRTIAEQGLLWHTAEDPFWREGVYYEFTSEEIDRIESVTNRLYPMCIEAARHLVSSRSDFELGLPQGSCERIAASFDADRDMSLYGRFDLRFDPHDGSVQMYEINGDTPTMLVESSVVQWLWKHELFANLDQFNSIDERLVAAWAGLRDRLSIDRVWLTGVLDLVEEAATLGYLADAALRADLHTHLFDIADLGLTEDGAFVDDQSRPLGLTFKLYPWEDMLNEGGAPHLERGGARWIEPLWKQALSHKGLLAALWEIYPHDENLIAASFSPHDMSDPLAKPFFGREGDGLIRTQAAQPHTCYQQWAPLPSHDGFYPVIGSWVIGGHAAGMGIRETSGAITDASAQFVPHVIDSPLPSPAQMRQWIAEDLEPRRTVPYDGSITPQRG